MTFLMVVIVLYLECVPDEGQTVIHELCCAAVGAPRICVAI